MDRSVLWNRTRDGVGGATFPPYSGYGDGVSGEVPIPIGECGCGHIVQGCGRYRERPVCAALGTNETRAGHGTSETRARYGTLPPVKGAYDTRLV